MDENKLAQIAKQTQDIVLKSNVQESFRPGLFDKIFSLLIKQSISTTSEVNAQPAVAGSKTEGEGMVGSLEKLMELSNLTKEQLSDIYDFSKDGLKVIATGLLKGNVAKKQQTVALLYLTASYYCYGKDREEAEILRLECENLGIVDQGGNFSRNLAQIPEQIISMGKKKSAQKEYKITVPGKEAGIDLLRQLIDNNEQSA